MALHEKPPISVWLGPARSGKTMACLKLLSDSGGSTTLVVPSETHATILRGMAAQQGIAGAEIAIVTPAALFRRFSGRRDASNTIRASARKRVVAAAASDRIGSDSYFSRVDGAPGFLDKLCDLIGELKLSEVTPQRMLMAGDAAAVSIPSPTLGTKARELAAVYAAYEGYLSQFGQEDDEGLALEAARRIKGLSAEERPQLVIMDGFYRMACAWRSVLKSFAEAGTLVIVTLTMDEKRPSLFRTPSRTLAELQSEFEVTEERFAARCDTTVEGALRHLEASIFPETDPAVTQIGERVNGGGDPIRIIDAPNPYSEAESVLREIRLAHDRDGLAWGEILIILRSVTEYGTILPALGERFGVPLCVQGRTKLLEFPTVKAAAALLRIVARGWRRQDVLDFLRYGALNGSRQEFDSVRRAASRNAVPDGVDHWMKFAASSSSEGIRERLLGLSELHRRLTGSESDSHTYAAEVRSAAEAFGWLRADKRPEQSQDSEAISNALQICESVSEVHGRIHSRAIPFAEWAEIILAEWSGASTRPGFKPDTVLVVDAYDARLRSAKLTAVMGLTERSFPRRMGEDPFFRDDEREALRSAGLQGLESRLERIDEERLLFYMAVTSCSKRLILSYPRTGAEGDFLPSFYLEDARAAAPGIVTQRLASADITAGDDNCVDDRDRMLYSLGILADRAAGLDSDLSWKERVSKAAESLGYSAADAADSVDLPPLPKLTSPVTLGRYAARRRRNVTEIESYNRCPFQHFTRYLLMPVEDPDGTGLAVRGRLYHQALAAAFRRRREDGKSVPVRSEDLVAIVEERLNEEAPDATLYQKGLMRRFLVQALQKFASREAEYASLFGGTPSYFELAFGLTQDETERGRDYDTHSTERPLTITSPDGRSRVQICGVMDRVDLLDDSASAMVMDYKTGHPPKIDKIRIGENIQMPIYLLALEELFGFRGAVACYDSAREPTRTRIFRPELAGCQRFGYQNGLDRSGREIKPLNESEYREMIDSAKAAILLAVENMEKAMLYPTPGEHCQFCDCADFCRTSRDSIHDGEAFDLLKDPQA